MLKLLDKILLMMYYPHNSKVFTFPIIYHFEKENYYLHSGRFGGYNLGKKEREKKNDFRTI